LSFRSSLLSSCSYRPYQFTPPLRPDHPVVSVWVLPFFLNNILSIGTSLSTTVFGLIFPMSFFVSLGALGQRADRLALRVLFFEHFFIVSIRICEDLKSHFLSFGVPFSRVMLSLFTSEPSSVPRFLNSAFVSFPITYP